MDEEVFMCLRGRLAKPMVKTAPEIYRKYIYVGSNNKPVLYVKLQKALYGYLRSALLFYQKLLKDLEDKGFELNPYDPCVANKVINGKQFTITWHLDDLKLSHVDAKVVDDTITWLKSVYDKDMRVSRGKKHEYLGMDLDYSVQGEVKVTMIDYLKRVITEFPEEITGTAYSPAAERLFTVRPNDESVPLEEKRAIAFHHCVAQLLFASARARKDIQPAVAFLTTRSTRARRRRLAQAEKTDALHQGGHPHATHPQGREPQRYQMVGGCIVCHSRQLQRPHRGHDITGKGISDRHVQETKDQHPQFDRIRTSGSGRRYTTNDVDALLPGRTRIQRGGVHFTPRQYERHATRNQW
jgi:hypothetical protein